MKKIIILLGIILFFSSLFCDILLHHDVPVSIKPGGKLDLTLEVRDGFNDVFNIKTLYRESGSLSFSELDMEKGSETDPFFSITIADAGSFQSGIEYYFIAVLNNGHEETLPQINPQMNPFRIISEMPVAEQSGFVLLSPDYNYSDISDDILIAISFFALEDQIEHSTIRFFYDGEDVTSQAKVFSNMIVYEVKNVKPGKHYYNITAIHFDGREIKSNSWVTNVKDKILELPLNLSGKATFTSYIDNVANDSEEKEDSDKWANFLMNVGGSYEWLNFKSKLDFSSLETKWMQPVNRYNLVLQVPHLDLIAGDYTPNYGTFLVSCKNIRGIHSKLYSKNFRMFFTAGSSKRSVNGKAYDDSTATGEIVLNHTAGTFQRNSYSLRFESGNPQSFTWGLGFAKNKDDIGSLKEIYYRSSIDSSQTVLPEDNIVVNTDINLALFNQRFIWGVEAAMSYYNINIIDGAVPLDSLDQDVDFPFDPIDFEDFFVVNKYMVPFKPGLSNMAYKTFLRAFFYRNFLNISYTAIGTSFNSLSTNYLQKDARIISINDNVNLMDNRLAVSLGLNFVSDNIYDEKEVTTTSTNYFVQTLYRPDDKLFFKLGLNSNNSRDDFESTPEDSLNTPIDITTMNIFFGAGYLVENMNLAPTKFSLSFNNSANSDEVNESFDYKKNNIVLSASSKFTDIPLETTLSYSLTLNDNSTFEDTLIVQKSSYNSLYIKGELELLDETLKPYFNFRYTSFGGDIDPQTTQMFNLGTSYSITSATSVSTDMGMKFYQNKEIEDDNYSKFTWKMKISQKF
jgi:hypothetical protein